MSNSVLTSAQETPAAGDWCGVYFGTFSTAASGLRDSVISYGGQVSGCAYGSPGNITSVQDARPSLTGNLITDSADYGVSCVSGSTPSMSDNSFANNLSGNTNGCL
ncbi:MAG: hypothetical protein AAFQ82_08465 [Myxococcota bacterium]